MKTFQIFYLVKPNFLLYPMKINNSTHEKIKSNIKIVPKSEGPNMKNLSSKFTNKNKTKFNLHKH